MIVKTLLVLQKGFFFSLRRECNFDFESPHLSNPSVAMIDKARRISAEPMSLLMGSKSSRQARKAYDLVNIES
jgi:hypothetical protein